MSLEQTHVPLDSVIQKVQQMANPNSDAQQLANLYNLDIVNVTWEDNARYKNSAFGPCISDMTLQVDKYRMPVMREPNFMDTTWDVPIDQIPIVIGNQSVNIDDECKQELETIPLKQYLQKFDEYISRPMENKHINLLRKNNKDTHVVMSSQCCFLPIEASQQTQFNLALFNYQSKPKEPAVLVIVTTSKGTSAQIVDRQQQTLLFNNHGKKAHFVGQRLTDHRIEKGMEIEGPMNKQEKQDNCIVIIQVPLLQKSSMSAKPASFLPAPQKPPYAAFYGGIENEAEEYGGLKKRSLPFMNASSNQMKRKQNKMAEKEAHNVEPAIVRISEQLCPICICGTELKKYQLQYAYMKGNDLNSGQIICDGCRCSIVEKTDIVWHCPKEHAKEHKQGYDLCAKCGENTLQFDELKGLQDVIRRDERYPIRVTLQYYKSTSNGVVNDEIIYDIKRLLAKSQAQADFIGSLVVDEESKDNVRPTKPDLNAVNNNAAEGCTKIYAALKEFGGKEWRKYYETFVHEEVTDADVLNLTDDDLKHLIPKIGPRNRFKAWMQQRRAGGDEPGIEGNINVK